jgi:hypothetical protein
LTGLGGEPQARAHLTRTLAEAGVDPRLIAATAAAEPTR